MWMMYSWTGWTTLMSWGLTYFRVLSSIWNKSSTNNDFLLPIIFFFLSCEFSFIWDKTRIIAWETAFQIALKNCYKEVGRKVSIHIILVKGEYMQSSTFFCRKFLLLLVIWRLLLVTKSIHSPWRLF